ncbi:MAG: hypothetical protein ABEJ89_02520 [Haloarculaceae archaeon]
MTEQSTTPPDGWTKASREVPGADRTYVHRVADGQRVLVGLAPATADAVRLEVAAIDDDAILSRQVFVVDSYGEEGDATEEMHSFMRLVADRLPPEDGEPLSVAVKRSLEAFESTTRGWQSLLP